MLTSQSSFLNNLILQTIEVAYRPSEKYMRGVGWAAHTVIRISKGVNSCLIGKNIDGIVVAFRGTQPNSALDWLQDAAVFFERVDGVPGRIHTGFHVGATNLYEPVKATLLDMLAEAVEESSNESSSCIAGGLEQPLPRIFLTGHSKGGSLASITAALMLADPDIKNADYVATFAAARVGDHVFQSYFNRHIRQRTYENYLDIVPFLPPGKEDYEAMSPELKQKVNE